MRGNTKIALAGVSAGGIVMAMACFPDIGFKADATGGSGGGSSAQASSSSSTASTGSTGAQGSSSSSSSSAGTGGGSSCVNAPCDCDGDEYKSMLGTCGGGDCDDANAKVYPGEATYYPTAYTTPSGTLSFDYDCNGTPDPDPMYNVAYDCSSLTSLVSCKGTGFLAKTPPPCGQTGTWGKCAWVNLTCTQQVITTNMPMTCK